MGLVVEGDVMKDLSSKEPAAGVVVRDGRLLCGHCDHLCGRSEQATGTMELKCGACHRFNRFDLTAKLSTRLSSDRLGYLRERERTDYHVAETLRILAENGRSAIEVVREFLDQRRDPRLVAI
jgi:phage FluMu protein Com